MTEVTPWAQIVFLEQQVALLKAQLQKGALPHFSELTELQQKGVRAAIGIGCATNGVYWGLRDAVNHEIVSNHKTYET